MLGRVIAGSKNDLPENFRLGDYVIDFALGEGGFSTVYAAHHHATQHPVALKVLHRRWCMVPQIVARFLREAEVVQRIDHPNIVTLHEVGWTELGRPFLVMERLDGRSLGRILNQRGSLPIREIADYFRPMCDALSVAHRAGIVHRDLKPSNVMVAHPGQPFWVKLIDFGIAKLVAPELPKLTRTGSQVGTMTAMCPEQILGMPIDGRADIYALGVLLYHCITGQRPFAGSPASLEHMHLHAPAPRASRIAPVGPAVDRVILRCLEKDPDRRYLSIDTFLLDLRTAVEEAGADPALAPAPIEEPPPADTMTMTSVQVIGLYAEVLVDGQTVDWDALDDDALDDVENVVERVVTRMKADGHVLPLRTSTSAMACRVVGDEGGGPSTIDRMLASARTLAEELRGRPGADPRIDVALYLEIGQAERTGSRVPQILSGPFIETRPWMACPAVPGTWMSRDVVKTVMDLASDVAWCRLKDD